MVLRKDDEFVIVYTMAPFPLISMKKLLLIPAFLCLTLAACSTPSEQDKVLEVQTYTQIMKTGEDFSDPIHGKGVGFFYGAVSGVEGINANGIAYIHVFEDGASTITVNLNIELPPSGKKYVAYVQDTSGSSTIKVGEMRSIVGDVRHSVKLETKENASENLSVKVRLEGRGSNDLVAEGTMKVPATAK